MGFYIRKAFRAGPVRFNLSKSGVGLSAGVRGARIGMGPRGAYVHGGRGGLYYRKQVGGTARSHQSSSVKIAGTDGRPAEQTSPTAGASGCLRVLSVLLVPLAFLIDWRVGVGIAAVAVAVIWKRRRQAAWKEQHEMLVGALDANPNEELLMKLSTSRRLVLRRAGRGRVPHRPIPHQRVPGLVRPDGRQSRAPVEPSPVAAFAYI